jgi:PAS domain-containing protein
MAVSWSIALADRINLLKAETEDTYRDLKNSEYRLSQIMEGFPLGVVVYGKDQKPQYYNKRSGEILTDPPLGIPKEIVAGSVLTDIIDYFSFKDTKTCEKYPLEVLPVYKALRGEPASVDNIEANISGKPVSLEVWSSPVMDDEGNIESAVTIFQDITKRRQADTELAHTVNLELLVENELRVK